MSYRIANIEWGLIVLKMKLECEVCHKVLSINSDTIICSFECTYCIYCAENIKKICKNCNGELTVLPKKKVRK